MVGSDGGRGSYGGEREWCRVLERGSSPGLIVACVCLLLPMSACHFLCPHVVACVCASLPVSMCRCPCPHVIACVCTSLPVSARRCPCPHIVARVHSHSWAVIFIYGQWHSVVVGSRWWVVVSPQCWHRCVVAWPLWLCHGARWCMSQLSCCCLVATSPAATGHL